MIGQIDKAYIKTRPYKLYSRLVSYFCFEGRPLTTKGQWINPIVFSFLGICKKIPPLKKIKQPVFIIGTGRSGTTILGIVLSMHKQVGFLNEPKALWHSIYPNEDIIGSYSMGKAFYELGESNANEKQRKNIHRILGVYLFLSGSERIVDKYPELIFRVPYVLSFFPDAKFLFLVRNGYDTCSSIKTWSERLGQNVKEENHDWWGRNNRKWVLFKEQILKQDTYYKKIIPILDDITDHTDMAALEWIATMRKGMEVTEKYPGRVKKIYYETLVSEPQRELTGLLSFCELTYDQKYMDYGINALSLQKSIKELALHPLIQPLFNDTMKLLGYEI